ncbi:uncharacterized protein HaLaN_18596, partial [Haematococcus lacustris]
VLAEALQGVAVLQVAHQLAAVMGCDRVLVMAAGKLLYWLIVQVGHAEGLLQLGFSLLAGCLGVATYYSPLLAALWQVVKFGAPLYYGALHMTQRAPRAAVHGALLALAESLHRELQLSSPAAGAGGQQAHSPAAGSLAGLGLSEPESSNNKYHAQAETLVIYT